MTSPAGLAVAVFAPVTVLTVTLERTADGEDEVHVHPGGQGVWQARMAVRLGTSPVLCTPLGGETGVVVDALLRHEGIDHAGLVMAAPNPAWIHDRRDGERDPSGRAPRSSSAATRSTSSTPRRSPAGSPPASASSRAPTRASAGSTRTPTGAWPAISPRPACGSSPT